MVPEFKSFSEIKQYKNGIFCLITEKIHGSNAQILIEENSLIYAGSRTRWLSPGKETDNYGFAKWVEDNKSELISKLGNGRHYGEWYGSGINSGYNLKEKRLALFNVEHFPLERPRPAGVDVVPTLYKGAYKSDQINSVFQDLKASGSKLVPGFMRPEGIVISFPQFGHRFKMVFEAEETGWTSPKGAKSIVMKMDVSKYLQPIRLEKLLSRDSNYLDQFPESLPTLAKEYILDLEKEEQLKECDYNTLKSLKKQVYPWIKQQIGKNI